MVIHPVNNGGYLLSNFHFIITTVYIPIGIMTAEWRTVKHIVFPYLSNIVLNISTRQIALRIQSIIEILSDSLAEPGTKVGISLFCNWRNLQVIAPERVAFYVAFETITPDALSSALSLFRRGSSPVNHPQALL